MLSSPTRLTRSVRASIQGSGASRGGKTPAGMSRPTAKYNTKMNKRKLSVTSTEDSAEDIGEEDEADEEDNDEDVVDESDDSAPSYQVRNTRKAGRPSKAKKPRVEEMFTDEDNAFLSDSENDDEIYGAVDDISDDEDLADDDLEGLEEAALATEFGIVGEALAVDFLGDIDGLSAYGFGEELDVAEFSSSTDSSEEAAVERRVRFENEVDHIPSRDVTSPVLEMKPVPAIHQREAFSREELQTSSHAGEISADHRAFFGDPDEDSDLTDDDLPAEAHTAPSALQQHATLESLEYDPPSPKRNKKSPPRRRGPVRGIFKIDDDKCWAVLDPSGKKINVCPAPATGRHEWLDKRAAEALGFINSAASSPQNSFATLLDEDDHSISSSQEGLEAMIDGSGINLMVAGLNGNGTSSSQHGYATGPPEAFYAPGTQIMGDYLIDPADFDQDEDDILDPTGEGRLQLEELIAFDDDSSDDEEIDSTPVLAAADLAVTPVHKKSDSYSHLNSDNIMSFRRGADLSSAQNQPWDFSEPRPSTPSFKLPTSPITRKRKARSPPYRGTHYEGTTPIRRELVTPKRRRTNTIS